MLAATAPEQASVCRCAPRLRLSTLGASVSPTDLFPAQHGVSELHCKPALQRASSVYMLMRLEPRTFSFPFFLLTNERQSLTCMADFMSGACSIITVQLSNQVNRGTALAACSPCVLGSPPISCCALYPTSSFSWSLLPIPQYAPPPP